nr:MAG: replication initiator protein [Microvirus sp.]
MACISPINIANPKGNSNKDRLTVPCGKCLECLQKKRADWSFRINQELKKSKSALFITFTYSDEKLPKDGNLNKRHFQLFMKSLRRKNEIMVQSQETNYNVSESLKSPPIKYYAVGEYGTLTLRPHYHAIIFNISQAIANELQNLWEYGMIHIGKVSTASIHYTTKYMITKQNDKNMAVKSFALISKGLGISYLENHKNHIKNKTLMVRYNGYKQQMPRYLQEKIFSRLSLDTIKQESNKMAEKKRFDDDDQICLKTENPFLYKVDLIQQKNNKLSKQIIKTEKL